MHKKTLVLLIGLFLIIGTAAMAQETTQNENEPLGYINYLEGLGGKILAQNLLQEAETNMLIFQGDELRSHYCRMEIYLTKAGYIRLDYNTIIDFAILNEESTVIDIWRGNLYIEAENWIEIRTLNLNKSSNLEPGIYRIEVTDKLKIYKNPMPIDDFDRWNNKREREIKCSVNERYLPEELTDYEYTLRRYGFWRYYPPYGYVWIPQVNYGWNPYFYGRWVYYPYYGWTWISYEPFGWCVYHYGRWHWHSVWGWYWIPVRGWRSAWVYWHEGYDYIGWYPMWHHHHHDRDYIPSHDRGLTVITKDQLKRGNNVSSIGKEQLREKLPQKIEVKQLKTNLEITPEKRVSGRISETKQTQTTRGTVTKDSTRSGTTTVGSREKVSDSKGQTSGSKGTVSSSKKKTSGSKGTVSSSKKKTSGSKGKTSGSKSSGKVKKKK